MKHTLIKTIIINRVVEMISKTYKITLDEARDMFYRSKTSDLLDDDETGLYGESPLYVFSVFQQLNEKQLGS